MIRTQYKYSICFWRGCCCRGSWCGGCIWSKSCFRTWIFVTWTSTNAIFLRKVYNYWQNKESKMILSYKFYLTGAFKLSCSEIFIAVRFAINVSFASIKAKSNLQTILFKTFFPIFIRFLELKSKLFLAITSKTHFWKLIYLALTNRVCAISAPLQAIILAWTVWNYHLRIILMYHAQYTHSLWVKTNGSKKSQRKSI